MVVSESSMVGLIDPNLVNELIFYPQLCDKLICGRENLAFVKRSIGVSPIVSALLLVVVVVAAALVSYGFVMGFIGRSTTTTTQSIIRVEAVSASSSEVKVYVGNYGHTSVTVDAIYVYTIDGTLVGMAYTSPTKIGVGEVREVTGVLSGTKLLEGSIYYVKVVT